MRELSEAESALTLATSDPLNDLDKERATKMVPKTAKPEKWHGTSGGYTNHDCRCDECRKANAIMQRETKARRLARPIPEHMQHGHHNTYLNYGCRCELCKVGHGRFVHEQKGYAGPYRSRAERTAARIAREEAKAAAKAAKGITYMGAHQRVRRVKGAAKLNACDFCSSQASDWALRADAELKRSGFTSRGTFETWSENPNDYRPLCRKCHKKYDAHVRHFGACAEGCTNPEHFPTAKVPAVRRAPKPPRALKDKTVCNNGHPLSREGATRVRKHDGRTECVECARERTRRFRSKTKLGRVAA